VAKEVEEILQSVGEDAEEEKRAREEAGEAILDILKDMAGKIKNEIETERREREANS
jgi:ElaB/YqjD/DUF883 family membrane-anchored ribosome-binding protein